MTKPTMLWKYRTPDTVNEFKRDRDIIVGNTLWFATPGQLNDPFEAKPQFQFNSSGRPTRAELERSAPKYLPHASSTQLRYAVNLRDQQFDDPAVRASYQTDLQNAMSANFQQTSICCFVGVESSILMWSYYADGHKGYCLGFGFDEPWTCNHPAANGKKYQLDPMPVKYSDSYPVIDLDADFDDPTIRQQLVDNAVLTKAKAWEHEKEQRCFRPGTPDGPQPFPVGALKVAMLGARMESDTRTAILALVRASKSKPRVFQARISESRFVLEFEPITY